MQRKDMAKKKKAEATYMFNKNDIVRTDIVDMTNEGDGIGHVDGYTLFVKDAVIGDTVLAKITRPKKSFAYARLEQILTPSRDRVEPRCSVARQCGGCRLQAMSYSMQLEFKEGVVRRNLERIGGFRDIPMEPIMGMENPWRYRNKAQYPIGTNKDGKLVAGYYAGRTHSIIDIRDCALSPKKNDEILRTVLAFAEEYKISAYDEGTGTGLLRHLLVREGFSSGQVLICLVINGRKLPKSDVLVSRLKEIFGVTSICLNVNTKRTNVILGREVIPLFGEPWITDTLLDYSFRISPLSFYQVNPAQTVKLYGKAVEYAALTGEETVFDLFCGIGTISHFLSAKAREVYGVEIVPEAIEDAKANARRNGITNMKFFAAAAEDVAERGYFDEENPLVRPDVIVLDPPRKGCEESLLRVIRELAPDRIVYVSCDSATLSRDLKILCEDMYELKRVCACDMFPQSCHVETVCLLSKLSEAKNHISVKVDMDEINVTAAESKATYDEIREWVQDNYGFHVTNLNIAQVKRKHGIIERENYNKPKTDESRQPGCPEEKSIAIEEAMRHFQMI